MMTLENLISKMIEDNWEISIYKEKNRIKVMAWEPNESGELSLPKEANVPWYSHMPTNSQKNLESALGKIYNDHLQQE
jgi:hypothetical protein